MGKEIRTLFTEKIAPIILFTSIGTFSWAVRGTPGYGAIPGCVFVGSLFAVMWLYLSNNKNELNGRKYSSGWVALAFIFGIGVGGSRGWSQYPQWINGRWNIYNIEELITVDVSPLYGYFWFFIAGCVWAGFGAVLLSWTNAEYRLNKREWIIRISMGLGFGLAGLLLFLLLPNAFLPLYDELDYQTFVQCTECKDAIDDIGVAWVFCAIYLGFLLFEIIYKHWDNVGLILTVSIITGALWLLFQALGMDDLWWRVWEASAGFAIGLGYGIAFVCFNSKIKPISMKEGNYPSSNPKIFKSEAIAFYAAIFWGLTYELSSVVQGHLQVYWGVIISKINPWVLIPWLIFTVVFMVSKIKNLNRLGHIQYTVKESIPHLFWILFTLYQFLRISGLLVTGPPSHSFERGFFLFYIAQWSVEMFIMFLLYIENRK